MAASAIAFRSRLFLTPHRLKAGYQSRYSIGNFPTPSNPSQLRAFAVKALTPSPAICSSNKNHLSPSEAGRAAFELRSRIDSQDKQDGKALSMPTLLSHAGLVHDIQSASTNSPLSPPIELSSTYERPPDGDYGANGLIYSRSHNPTRKLLEDAVGQLEMASRSAQGNHLGEKSSTEIAPSFAFSSGMAAVASLLLAHSSPAKVLVPKDVYHGVPTQLFTSLNDHGVEHEAVDMTNNLEVLQKVEESIDFYNNINSEETHPASIIIWLETPSNPLCQITDIREICKALYNLRGDRQNVRITIVVDSTWAPPCITQPLLLGADVVLHSGTKYLGGHSDVLLGIVSCSTNTAAGQWLSERLKIVQSSVGAVASPLDCWLTLRGLRTLHLRVERQCQTALELAKFLDHHKNVTKCHYPGLESHPQHDIAKQQMVVKTSSSPSTSNTNMFGGMLSFEVESEAMAMAVAGAVRVIRRATSLGGTESLIEHRASIEPPERRTSPPGLLRLSVGLEDVVDLRNDLDAALNVASKICH
ncbi:hypothetical protein ACHAXS_007545 [Conticribra weissflogii]